MADPSDTDLHSLRERAIAQLIAHGPVFAWATDPMGRSVWASAAWTAFMGEHVPLDPLEWCEVMVHPDDRMRVVGKMRDGVLARGVIHDTYRMRRADGEWRWIVSHADPMTDEHGAFLGWAGTCVDVTEVSAAREHVESYREFLRAIADDIPGIVFTIDGDGQVGYLSREGRHLFGVPDDVESLPLSAFMPADACERMLAENARVFAGEPAREVEHVVQTRLGTRRLLARKRLIRAPLGGDKVVLGLATDVTELRAGQDRAAALAHELHLRRRHESIGHMAGAIAHDFNNLLAIVIGNLDLVASAIGADATATEALERIEDATGRATTITRQMLALSGSGRMVSEVVDVATLLDDLAPTLRALVPEPMTLSVTALPDLRLTGDPESIRHALKNLVVNAVESMRDPGAIAVRAGAGSLDADRLRQCVMSEGCAPGAYVSIEVCDSGEGMTAETLANAFEPFFSTRAFGRGLGLTAVRGIVRAHDGAIEVESAPAAGTTVRLWLPVASAGARPDAAAPVERTAAAPVRVLIVDDEAAVRSLACAALAGSGFETTPAVDGDAALALWDASGGAFDIVVSDVAMPGTGGVALVRALRERRATTPIVLMSGFDAMNATRELDVVAVLEKPFRIAQLLAAVRDAAALLSRAE